jgi:hypothetical protein
MSDNETSPSKFKGNQKSGGYTKGESVKKVYKEDLNILPMTIKQILESKENMEEKFHYNDKEIFTVT